MPPTDVPKPKYTPTKRVAEAFRLLRDIRIDEFPNERAAKAAAEFVSEMKWVERTGNAEGKP